MTGWTRAGRYNPDDPSLRNESGDDQVSTRHAALTVAAAGVRVRRGANVPVEQILLVAASILFPLGLVLIFLGWEGASHTGKLYEQVDYLISGGLLGVGLSCAGGFLYFGYWLSRQLGESRRQNAVTLQALLRLERAIEGSATLSGTRMPAAPLAPLDGPGPPAAAAAVANGSDRRPGGRTRGGRSSSGRSRAAAEDMATGEIPVVNALVATPRGSLLHRPDCPVVARRKGLRTVAAGSQGYGYCTMCDAAGVLA